MKRGYVYVFSIGGVSAPDGRALYKIGLSRDPIGRAKTLGAQPGPVREIHRIGTTDMDWLERELHRKYRAKKHYREWFLLDPPDLRELAELRVCDRMPEETLFGRPIDSAHLPRGLGKPLVSPAACADYLQQLGWKARAYPAVSPGGEAWFVVAERGENRIARGGKTEEIAWWHVVTIQCRAFRATKPTPEDLLIQERGAG